MIASSSCVPCYLPPPGTLFLNAGVQDVRWYHGPPDGDSKSTSGYVTSVPEGVPVMELCALGAGYDSAEHYIYVILADGRIGRRVWSVFTEQLIRVIS